MNVRQVYLIKERMTNVALSHDLSLAILQSDFDRLETKWGKALWSHAEKCRSIMESKLLTPQGSKHEVQKEIDKLLKLVAEEDNLISSIAKAVEEIDGAIMNALAVALGKNRVMSDTDRLIEQLRQQEVRALWPHLQDRAEQEYKLKVANAKKFNLALGDEERKHPDIIKDQFLRACETFSENIEVNRLLVNAVMQSPVPILTDEIIQGGMELLKQSVAPDRLIQRQAALVRAEAVGIMANTLKGCVEEPWSLNLIYEPYDPVSDQERAKATA